MQKILSVCAVGEREIVAGPFVANANIFWLCARNLHEQTLRDGVVL